MRKFLPFIMILFFVSSTYGDCLVGAFSRRGERILKGRMIVQQNVLECVMDEGRVSVRIGNNYLTVSGKQKRNGRWVTYTSGYKLEENGSGMLVLKLSLGGYTRSEVWRINGSVIRKGVFTIVKAGSVSVPPPLSAWFVSVRFPEGIISVTGVRNTVRVSCMMNGPCPEGEIKKLLRSEKISPDTAVSMLLSLLSTSRSPSHPSPQH